jgi:hypothetical protein
LEETFPLPGVCLVCTAVFPSIVHIGGGSTGMVNCSTNCPYCGGKAAIPDGVYEAVDGVLQLFNLDEHPLGQWRHFQSIIETAIDRGDNEEQVVATVERDVPAFRGVLDFWKPKDGAQVVTYLRFLGMLIGSVIVLSQSCSNPTKEQVIRHIFEVRVSTQESVTPGKARRNDLCPCGSGKKHKRCCGVRRK